MSTEPNERATRVLALGQGLLQLGQALEDSDWTKLELVARECARQARVLSLLDREEKSVDDRSNDS